MFVWIKRHRNIFGLTIIVILGRIYDVLFSPIVSANIENWAGERGLTNKLVEIEGQIPWLWHKFLQFVDFLGDWLINPYFVGFVAGLVVSSLWVPVVERLVKIGKNKASRPRTMNSELHALGLYRSKRDGFVEVDHANFDIIKQNFFIRAQMSDDGIDITPWLQIRNRSAGSVWAGNLKTKYNLDGAEVDSQSSRDHALSVQSIGKETAVSYRLPSNRLYDQGNHSGKIEYMILFGQNRASLENAIVMSFEFKILSYPKNKSVDAVLELDLQENVKYFVRDSRD